MTPSYISRLASTAVACVALFATQAFAVTAPSVFTNALQVQGEAPGTEFADWDALGLTLATTDAADNPGFIDIASVEVANNDEFLFLRIKYHTTLSANTFIAIDTDQNTATGFDIFELGEIGSDAAFQNDFPFLQGVGAFNTGIAQTGGPLGNGGASIFPFFDQNGDQKELAIPIRDAMISFPSGPTYPNDSIDIMIYTDQGNADVTEVISYTFATAPVVVGDYNGNGTVDAADYTIYRDTFGDLGAELAADGDNSGEVDPGDYTVWANNFGSTSSTATAVPEPTAIVSLLSAMALASVRRCKV